MKIALAQLNYHIGNFDNNVLKIKNNIKRAKQEGADLVVFAELAVCGYSPMDLFHYDSFVKKCQDAIEDIAKASVGIGVIVGAPSLNPNPMGKKLLNSAFLLNEGKIKAVYHKSLLPDYDVFDEYRYFEPSRDFKLIEFNNYKLALPICEDIWEVGEKGLYPICPMELLIKDKPGISINIAASPFSYTHAEERREIISKNASKYHLPLFYLNHIGAHTDIIFDGGSMVADANGNIIDELNYFDEDFRIYEVAGDALTAMSVKRVLPAGSAVKQKNKAKIERIHDALILGIRDYFQKSGFKKAVLGLSGGIDSAVVLALAERALGKENVQAVLLPSKFSSDHSIRDAEQLAQNLGCPYETVPIENAVSALDKILEPHFKGLPMNVTEENIQARIRGLILMAFSNKFGHILLNTTNKSEAAVGYGTLYGDLCGGLSVLGDVYKTEVYELAAYINKDKTVIPRNSIEKPPSAELRHNQKDSDSLPEYDILDKLLYQYIELSKGPAELLAMGFDQALVEKVMQLVNRNEYKRYQTPPILRVSRKAFGTGRKMPIVAKY